MRCVGPRVSANTDAVIYRITSYNVCYTKLLRHPVEQVAAQFRDQGRLAELRSEILQRKARAQIRTAATLVEDPSMAGDDAADAAPPAEKKAAKKKAAKKKAAKKKSSK